MIPLAFFFQKISRPTFPKKERAGDRKKTRKFEGERAEHGKTLNLKKKVTSGAAKPAIGKKKARTRGPDYFVRKEERRKAKRQAQ